MKCGLGAVPTRLWERGRGKMRLFIKVICDGVVCTVWVCIVHERGWCTVYFLRMIRLWECGYSKVGRMWCF